jgi:hypothetical protein
MVLTVINVLLTLTSVLKSHPFDLWRTANENFQDLIVIETVHAAMMDQTYHGVIYMVVRVPRW